MDRPRGMYWAALACRIILGVIFIYAGAVKIMDPAGFARAIGNYRILPELLLNPSAVILPWVEVVSGIFLVLGVGIQGASLLVGALLTVFFFALSSSLIRGLDISCGCFSTSAEAHRITWSFLVRDFLLICMAAIVFFSGQAGPMPFSSTRKQDRA